MLPLFVGVCTGLPASRVLYELNKQYLSTLNTELDYMCELIPQSTPPAVRVRFGAYQGLKSSLMIDANQTFLAAASH